MRKTLYILQLQISYNVYVVVSRFNNNEQLTFLVTLYIRYVNQQNKNTL